MRLEIFARWLSGFLLLAAALVTPPGMAQAPAPPRASGKITALIPLDFVLREQKSLDAKKDMPVFWGDTVKTERGGRVRVQLEDGSILNVGSQSSLLIQRHDANTQQTELELIYGRVRANAVKIATPSGEFNVRTRAAVAGVVGTEEYLDATDILTTVIALGGGQVVVISTDPRFPDPIFLNPGEAVTLIAGRQPPPKRPATTEELVKAVQETEVDAVATLSRSRALPGATFEATISGKGLNTFTGLSFSQPGLQVKTRGEVTATQIPVTITVATNVPPGTYPLTIERPGGPARSSLVITMQAEEPTPGPGPEPPPSQTFSVTRGAKFSLDASSARTPPGTQIVSYQWQIPNTPLGSRDVTFAVNTSLLPPGNYTIQLVVVNDRGQTATQQYPLTVDRGIQPAEIIRAIASAYESLQPSEFLKYFDEQKFRNYSGFAAAIEDSFRNQLDTVRVFQRPVNCSVVEEQDQAVCQADFQLQFTKKNQPSELLDAQGNPVPPAPPGVPPPPGAMLGKRILTGSERSTIRYERVNVGWKVVDYSATVSCPSGATTKGLNVGSCILALGSASAPSFQILNLRVFSTDLPLNGSVSGTFEVVPMGGFNSSIEFTAQAQINDIRAKFDPRPFGPSGTVSFTVFAPTTAPAGFSGAQPFKLVITGRDSSGSITATANVALVLEADFTLSLSPPTSSSAPAPVMHNSTLPLTVQVVPGTGFAGTVFIDFPNLPAGFQATSGNVAAGATGSFPVRVTPAAVPGPALLTVRGTLGAGFVKTATLFVDVISDFTLNVNPPSTSSNPIRVIPGGTIPLSMRVVPISGFAGTVPIDFPNLPTRFQATPGTLAAGETRSFPVQVAESAPPGPTQFTVRGTFGPGSVQTVTVFVLVASTFTLDVSPPSTGSSPIGVSPGTTLTLSVHVIPGPGFTGTVSIDFPNLPAGFQATPGTVAASAAGSFPVQVAATVPLGATQFSVRGTSAPGFVNTATVFVLVTFVTRAFTLNVSPPSTLSSPIVVAPGGTLLLSVQVVAGPGFTGTVSIDFPNLPTGFQATPGTLAAGATGSFPVQVAATVPLGPIQFTIRGTSAPGFVNTATVFVLVTFVTRAFTLNVSPPSTLSSPIGVTAGGTLPLSVQVVAGPGFTGTVSIDFPNLPTGFQATPATVPAGETGSFPVQVAATVPGGLTQFTVRGTSGTVVSTATVFVFVEVTTNSTFSLSLIPFSTSTNPIPVNPGGTIPLSVVVVPTLGFAGTVSIDFPNLPPGFQVTPVVAAGTFFVFLVQVHETALGGLTQFTVRGTSGTVVSTATVFVEVTTNSTFFLIVIPSSTSTNPFPVIPGVTIPLSVTVVPTLGFAGTVSIDFPNLPPSFQATPGTVAAFATGSFPVQVAEAATGGLTQFTVRGTSGTVVRTVTVFVEVVVLMSPRSSPSSKGANSQASSQQKPDNIVRNSFSLTTNPPTSPSAPLLLQANSQTNTFANIHVNADGSFAGPVKLGLNNVPTGVTATLVPSVVDLSASTLQVVQLQFQTTTSQVPFGPTGIQVTATSGSLTSDTTVFIASQGVSGLPPRGDRNSSRPPRVLQVRYPGGTPGGYTPVTIIGESLSNITSVLSDSLLLSATLEPGATDTQMQLSVFVKPGAPPGTHTLMLVGPQGSVPIAFQVKPGELQVKEEHSAINSRPTRPSRRAHSDSVASAQAARSIAAGDTDQHPDEISAAPRNVIAAPTSPDLVLRADDLTMTPANPRPGDTVTFRVRITNQGAQPAEDAAVEFSIAGTTIRQREHVSLAPKESQTFQFEWRAAGNRRLEPRVVIDPENRIKGLNRANTTASLQPFELAQPTAAGATTGRAVSRWERAKVRLTAGGCEGFRFASGTEQPCGAGADFELRSSPGGESLVIEADGVRNVGGVPLDQFTPVSRDALATSEAVQPGSTYVIQTRRSAAVVRVTQIQGLGAARKGPPPSLRGPQLRGMSREGIAPEAGSSIIVSFEWQVLSRP